MEVFWKDSKVDHYDGLTRLNQFTRAYASATIDKAFEVQQLIKENDERIIQLEHELQAEKHNINQQL